MFDLVPDPACAGMPPSGVVALQQSHQWQAAIRLLGSQARVQDLGTARAVVIHRTLPAIGSTALVSRADLGLTQHTAFDLRLRLGARHLVVNSETSSDAHALAAAGFFRIAAPRRIAELPLLPSTDRMAAALHPKWRNRARKGQNQGLTLTRRPMPADQRYWLLRAEAAQARRLRYRPLPPNLIAAIAACSPGSAQVFTAFHRGQRVAAMLFLRHGRQATYQIGWTNPDGRHLSAAQALMWKAMVDLQALGVDWIDLGAADATQAPGLVHFKRGTGAKLRDLGGTWLQTAWMQRRPRLGNAPGGAAISGPSHAHMPAE